PEDEDGDDHAGGGRGGGGGGAGLHRREGGERREHDELAPRGAGRLRGPAQPPEAHPRARIDRARREARDEELGEPAHLPSLGRICVIFCFPATISARKLMRSTSPFASQVVSMRMPGSILGVIVRPCIVAASCLRSKRPIF